MSTRIVLRIADALTERGIDAAEACASVGIAPELIRDVDGIVDADAYGALWGKAVALTNDPWIALDIARHAPESQNFLRFLCLSSATLGEGFERASRFLRLVTDSVAWSLVLDANSARFVSTRPRERRPNDVHLDVFFVCENMTLARVATGLPALAPREVRLAHPAPADATPLRVFLRAPVVWDAERTEIVFERRAMDLPLVDADASVVTFFEAFAAKRLQERSSLPPVTDEVLRCITALLGGGHAPGLDEVAERLATSSRTLRRRLDAEGTSFQQLLDGHRRDLAVRLLLEGTSSVDQIASALGFADATSFHRSFRRWHGTTPQRFAQEERLRRARGH